MTKSQKVDDLKYQKSTISNIAIATDELMTLKLRYKNPKGKKSQLLTHVIQSGAKPFETASIDYRFSAAVTGFSLILRNSEYIKDLSVKQVIDMANGAKGKDSFGYRQDFVELVKRYEMLNYISAK